MKRAKRNQGAQPKSDIVSKARRWCVDHARAKGVTAAAIVITYEGGVMDLKPWGDEKQVALGLAALFAQVSGGEAKAEDAIALAAEPAQVTP